MGSGLCPIPACNHCLLPETIVCYLVLLLSRAAPPHTGDPEAPVKEKVDTCLLESPYLLNVNRKQTTGIQVSCDLTLASAMPVHLAAQGREKIIICVLKKKRETTVKDKRMLND